MTDENTEIRVAENLLENVSDSNSLAMQLIFDNGLYKRTRALADIMSKANCITPAHLIGKPESCYAIVTRSIMWGLDPFSVAPSTYEVKGKLGFEGKLCHAILEKSNRFEGRIKYEMLGDWSKIQGKFTKKNNGKGEFCVGDWKDQDEEGLGVRVVATLKGEEEPEDFVFWLKQAHPRNSTLWATDPMTQIKYLAIRRFSNSVVPDIFMGVHFDHEDSKPGGFKNVTPRSQKSRTEATNVNDILQAQVTSEVTSEITEEPAIQESPEGEDGTTALGKDEGKIEHEANEDLLHVHESKAFEIMTALRSAKTKSEITTILHEENGDHILFLPEELALEIHDFADEMNLKFNK